MKVFNDYSDSRLRGGCVYCEKPAITRDHVPARAFLDKPYPANLQVVPSCEKCNNALSKDEAYVAFLIKYLKMLNSDEKPENFEIGSSHSDTLEERVINSITLDENGKPIIQIESERITNVIKKFAICHVLYDLGEKLYAKPSHIAYTFDYQLTNDQINDFNNAAHSDIFPEVGSRAMQRIVTQGDGWVVVQPNSYRYYVSSDNQIIVRMVIREILYCEVVWSDK